MSEAAMSNAASELRTIKTTMSSAVSDLTTATTWSGADSDRFEREWREQVTTPLGLAADAVDGAAFTEL